MAAGGAALFMTAHMGRMGFWHSVAVALLPGPIGLSKIKDSPLRVTLAEPKTFPSDALQPPLQPSSCGAGGKRKSFEHRPPHQP